MAAGQSGAAAGSGPRPVLGAGIRPDHGRRRSPPGPGLTERTFFRHFADKREVLFGGSALLQERIVAGVAGAPAADGPLDAVARGLDAAAAMLGEFRRDLSRQRQAVIAANPELRERELAKLADYAAAVAAALRQRGVASRRRPWPPRPA